MRSLADRSRAKLAANFIERFQLLPGALHLDQALIGYSSDVLVLVSLPFPTSVRSSSRRWTATCNPWSGASTVRLMIWGSTR